MWLKNGSVEPARPCCFPVSGRAFWEAFWGRSRGLARYDAETQLKVHLEANSRCKLYPKAAKTSIFLGSGRSVLTLQMTQTQVKKRCPWARQAMLFPCFGARVLGSLLGAKSWLGQAWRPNTTDTAFRSQVEVQIVSQSCNNLYFYRFWTQRLTRKMTQTQVKKRCPWALQAMLFPCFGARVLGSMLGVKSWVVAWPGITPKHNWRCISKPIRGANCVPKLQKPLFF